MTYKVFKDYLYPGWDRYDGPTENCTFFFRVGPEQLDWLGLAYSQMDHVNNLLENAEKEVENNDGEGNGHILRMQVERDDDYTIETRYRITIVAYTNHPGLLAWAALISALAVLTFAVSFTILAIWASTWDPEDVEKLVKWPTYALIGGGILALLTAIVWKRPTGR